MDDDRKVSDLALRVALVTVEEPPQQDELPPIEAYEADVVDYGCDVVGPPMVGHDGRPVVQITPDVADVVDAVERALVDAGGIYQRAGGLVRPIQAPEKVTRIERSKGSVVIGQMESPSLIEAISGAARVEKFDGRKHAWVHALPPGWMAETLASRGTWAFPPLRGIITAPTIRESGTILDRPGYDEETGLLLLHSGRWPRIPNEPTQEDARKALQDISEAVSDFPFAKQSDGYAALSAVLTIVGRAAFTGSAPLFVVGAKDAGTGKTLLANVISVIGTGTTAPAICPWGDPDEGRKTMLALALAGDPVALLDNWPIGRGLGDESLDGALTSGTVRGRILGRSEIVTAPWETVMLVTGNNISYAGDTARRVIPIDLDAGRENPEERTGFGHDPLIPWVQENRKRLVVAALTAIRAYVVAGRPSQGLSRIGSFEPWSDLIRSCVVWAGGEDPASGRASVKEKSDPTRELVTLMLRQWWDCWGGNWKTVADIRADLKNGSSPEFARIEDTFHDLLPPSKSEGISGKALGKMFARFEGNVRGGLVLRKDKDKSNNQAVWKVEVKKDDSQ